MEQLLIKMARQLDALDEASLLALWDKYAVIVSHFEPTKRWEEAALVFSFIQAKRWKNQLFNYSWSAQVHPGAASQPVAEPDFFLDPPTGRPAPAKPKRKAAIIQFRPHRSPEKDASEEPGGKGRGRRKTGFSARFTVPIPPYLCRLQAGSSWTVAGFPPAILTDRKREAQ